MASAIGTTILDLIRRKQLQGNDPDEPMSERLPSGQDAISVARSSPDLTPPDTSAPPLRAIDMARAAPVQDHTGTQFLQSPSPVQGQQLDASNLAGPVPTDLTPPITAQQAAMPLRSDVGTDAFGVPTAIPAQQAATTIPGMPLSANAQALRDYKLPTVAPNETYSGLKEKNINDPDIQNMGRGASFGRAFQQGLEQGGIVHALESGVMGLIDPDYGKQAAVNVKNRRFFMQKAKEQEAISRDPVLQAALKVGEEQAMTPDQIARNAAYTQARVGGQLQVGAQRIEGNLRSIAARGLNTQDAIAARAKFKADNDINAARDFYSGATDPETGKPYSAAEVEQLAHDDVAEQKNAKLDKLYSQASLAQSRSDNLSAVTKNLPQKFADAHQKVQGYLDNVETNRKRLELQQGNAADRQENERQLRQGTALQSHINSLENEQKGQLSILNNPFNQDQGSKDAAAARIKEIHDEITQINQQRLDTSGAPGKGQPATKPGARTSPTGKVVSPDELKSYADANFAGDLEKAKQAYLHHARQRGITVTFQ